MYMHYSLSEYVHTFAIVAALLRSPFPEGAVPFPGGPPGGGREPGG